MAYTIKEVSAMLNIPASTLRYYEKEGLLNGVERMDTGYRLFSDENIKAIRFIECLKSTGMAIKDIRTFFEWVQQGDASLQQRYEMFLERRRVVEEQIAQLQKTLEVVDYKCWYYEKAVEAGTLKVHDNLHEREDPLAAK